METANKECKRVVRSLKVETYLLGTAPLVLRGSIRTQSKRLLHNPLEDYRDILRRRQSEEGETALQLAWPAIKYGMARTVTGLPFLRLKRAQLARMLFITPDGLPLWGVPQMRMFLLKMGRGLPDLNTCVVFPQWAMRATIHYPEVLQRDVVLRLLAASGIFEGIGSHNPGRGGTDGTFELVAPDDPRFLQIVKTGGRDAQMAALKDPEFYDEETEELYGFVSNEKSRKTA